MTNRLVSVTRIQ